MVSTAGVKTCIAIARTMSEITSCYLPVCVELGIACYLLSSKVYTQKFHTKIFLHRGTQDFHINTLQFSVILQLVNSTLQICDSTLMLYSPIVALNVYESELMNNKPTVNKSCKLLTKTSRLKRPASEYY